MLKFNMMNSRLNEFLFDGIRQEVRYIETMEVNAGVICDVYVFVHDKSKDLGIVKISKGRKTPLQKVIKGTRTIEGYISGKGRLIIDRSNGQHEVVEVNENAQIPLEIVVMVDDVMQWQADTSEDLQVYEICFPPYEDGRFISLSE